MVRDNQGYIGTINQPVYNIKVYSNNDGDSQKSKRSLSPDRDPSFYAMGKPNRPNSSNVYTAGGRRHQVHDRKKRPMTAAGQQVENNERESIEV